MVRGGRGEVYLSQKLSYVPQLAPGGFARHLVGLLQLLHCLLMLIHCNTTGKEEGRLGVSEEGVEKSVLW